MRGSVYLLTFLLYGAVALAVLALIFCQGFHVRGFALDVGVLDLLVTVVLGSLPLCVLAVTGKLFGIDLTRFAHRPKHPPDL
ncbi:MAG TPA: hypothetical protein VGG72_36035 [Bryobacteraceae bacterium]